LMRRMSFTGSADPAERSRGLPAQYDSKGNPAKGPPHYPRAYFVPPETKRGFSFV
jgi:hypothetical protein